MRDNLRGGFSWYEGLLKQEGEVFQESQKIVCSFCWI